MCWEDVQEVEKLKIKKFDLKKWVAAVENEQVGINVCMHHKII